MRILPSSGALLPCLFRIDSEQKNPPPHGRVQRPLQFKAPPLRPDGLSPAPAPLQFSWRPGRAFVCAWPCVSHVLPGPDRPGRGRRLTLTLGSAHPPSYYEKAAPVSPVDSEPGSVRLRSAGAVVPGMAGLQPDCQLRRPCCSVCGLSGNPIMLIWTGPAQRRRITSRRFPAAEPIAWKMLNEKAISDR